MQESGWLIEKVGLFPEWMTACQYSRGWTADSAKAVRFSRQCDADAVIRMLGLDSLHHKSTEHIWSDK